MLLCRLICLLLVSSRPTSVRGLVCYRILEVPVCACVFFVCVQGEVLFKTEGFRKTFWRTVSLKYALTSFCFAKLGLGTVRCVTAGSPEACQLHFRIFPLSSTNAARFCPFTIIRRITPAGTCTCVFINFNVAKYQYIYKIYDSDPILSLLVRDRLMISSRQVFRTTQKSNPILRLVTCLPLRPQIPSLMY